ncbi:hypothetical protein GCM10011348_33430 [Marinobacterium nitratireducens]|uniref:Uncharacterized protein n=1 Tax=Marinobacterium nitratireducens TaxID=518897 RepID=A0A917ZMM2_9GAMM|nr:hypothetical protein [Marinobacterium nitratireducens]GGO85268.1 hypothetical protein GCM10011348_33430 [Marinobacterium nitratireducens]
MFVALGVIYVYWGRWLFNNLGDAYWMILGLLLALSFIGMSGHYYYPKQVAGFYTDEFYPERVVSTRGRSFPGISGYSETEKKRIVYRGIPHYRKLQGIMEQRAIEDRKITALWYYSSPINQLLGERRLFAFRYQGQDAFNLSAKLKRTLARLHKIYNVALVLLVITLFTLGLPYLAYRVSRRVGYIT